MVYFSDFVFVDSEELSKKIRFCPYDAVDGLRWSRSNCTHRKRFRDFLFITIIAF